MKTIKCYFSHPIRGKAGNKATKEEMAANNQKAVEMGNVLMLCFPELKIYIPGELDGFLIPRGINPIDIVKELLALDCAIIHSRDLLLVYNWCNISSGMKQEIDYALKWKKAMIMFKGLSEAIDKIEEYLK